MIQIINKQQCCGCAACQQRCPKHCISMLEDNEGFSYPVVDKNLCVDCGLCEKVCHELKPYERRTPLRVLAVINHDENIRSESSSGGIFSIIAEQIIKDGGVVFGAKFDNQWQVTLDYTDSIIGLSEFRGSKYVQARTANTYAMAEKFLKNGRKVMFSGTPCQIAGLHHYLNKQYDNLLTVDFVCHGVPSPKVWGRYLDEVARDTNKVISSIEFRNKDNGWKLFNFKLFYTENDNTYFISSCHQQNHYMRAFLSDLILRPSCYDCKAKHGSSMSDITIADYWGISKNHPEMDDDKGTGLVFVNSDKGNAYLDLSKCKYKDTKYSDASNHNPGLGNVTKPHMNRKKFFAVIDDADRVCDLIDKMLKPTIIQRFADFLVDTKDLCYKQWLKVNKTIKLLILQFNNVDNMDC